MNSRHKMIASAAAVLLGLPIALLVAFRSARALADPIARSRIDQRLILHPLQKVETGTAGYEKAVRSLDEVHVRKHYGANSYTQPVPAQGDLDGDEVPDKVEASGIHFHIYLSSRETTVTRWFGNASNASVGITDVDMDGYLDAWRCDTGDQYVQVFYGNGQGRFTTQVFPLDVEISAFCDIENDGQPDIVGQPLHDAQTTGIVWARLSQNTAGGTALDTWVP